MATIDVSEVLSDPDFASEFDVLRSTETVDERGLAQFAPKTFRCVTGVVQAASGRTLRMLPDLANMDDVIEVYTRFKLQALSDHRAPDIIKWNGRDYLVTKINDWSNYGRGYVQAVCTMQQMANRDV